MRGWAEALDDMEQRLVDAQRLLTGSGSPPGAFSLPPGLGPLPPGLRQRAEQVLAATMDVERRFEVARAAVLAALRHRPPAGPGAAYVDRRG